MKKITLLFALLLSMQALVAQDWIWEQKIESATGTKVDILDISANQAGTGGAGVLYAVGTFTGTLTFGSNSYTAIAGSQDGFIAQFDYSGNLNWISPFGGTGLDGATGIVSDYGGNIYVTGYYTLQFCSYDTYKAEFGLKKLTSTSLSTLTPITANSSSILSQEKVPFIAKFNRIGQAQWANLVEATDGEGTATALSIDGINGSGDVYLTGFFKSNISYPGGGAGVYVPGGTLTNDPKTFVAKYSTSTGNIVWANYIGNTNTSSNESVGTDITVEADDDTYNGDVYISGYYKGIATLNHHSTSSLTLPTSSSSYNGLIAKLDQTNGKWMWAKEIHSNGDDFATSISCYPDGGEVYISGYYPADYSITCEVVSGTTKSISGVGGTDIFTAKYTSAGACSWVNSYGGSYNDYGTEIEAFKYDVATLYIAGMYTESATFNSESLTGVSGETDHYLAKIDRSNGNTIWVESIDASEKGTGSFEGIFNGPKITYDINIEAPIFISGAFKGTDMPTFVNTLGTPVQAGYVAAHRDCSCPAVKNVSVARDFPIPGQATVFWDNPNYQACISGYDILYTEQVPPFTQQNDPGYPYGSVNSNPITTSGAGNPYEWIVVTNCSTGQNSADPVIAKKGGYTAKSKVVVTEGTNKSNEVSVYPNPTKDNLSINTTFADNTKGINSIEVNNVLGQRVKVLSFSSAVKNYELSMDGLENGVYTVTVTSGADQHTFKIVKE